MSDAETGDTFFLDTNILIYAVDQADLAKQQIAVPLVREAILSGRGIISIQVVQEFLNVARRKFERPMTVEECRGHVQNVLEPLCSYFPSITTIDRALGIIEETGYHFYDALILAAAIESGCRTLYSEDLQHGRAIQGLTIVNPFHEPAQSA
ncbi:MAG: PIN domain-containing protein [Candidatus Promineofilum sp.]|nr:PIN domain-containing protein [Promineifilum sp.]